MTSAGGGWAPGGRAARRVVAAAGALAFVAAACSGGGGPARDADGVLRVATLLPPPGTLDDLAVSVQAGVAVAVAEVQAAGGEPPAPLDPVEVTEQDGADAPGVGEAVAGWLDAGFDAVVGPLESGDLAALGGELGDAGIIACSPSATVLADTGRWVVRTGATDAHQAVAVADELVAAGRVRTAVVRSPVSGGDALAERLAAELTARGIDVVGPLGLAADGTDAADVATRISGAGVDSLVLATVPRPGVALLAALAQGGLPPSFLPTWATGGMLQSDLATVAGDPAIVTGLHGVAPSATPEAPELTAALGVTAPGVPVWYAAQAHDCVVALALASLAAGGDDPGSLRAALGAVVAGGQRCTSYGACAALLAGEADVDIDYDGASGPLDLDGDGQPITAAVERWEVRPDGRVVVVGQGLVTGTPAGATSSSADGSSTTAVGQVSTPSEGGG